MALSSNISLEGEANFGTRLLRSAPAMSRQSPIGSEICKGAGKYEYGFTTYSQT